MRTWQKATLGLFITIMTIVVALGVTGAYVVLRHLEKTVTGEAEANNEMDAVPTALTARERAHLQGARARSRAGRADRWFRRDGQARG